MTDFSNRMSDGTLADPEPTEAPTEKPNNATPGKADSPSGNATFPDLYPTPDYTLRIQTWRNWLPLPARAPFEVSATAARHPSTLAAQHAEVTAKLSQVSYEEQFFHGAFYDPRCTAVVGAMFFIGCCGFGYLRATYPKLIIFAIFGSIMLDVIMSYAPNSLTIPTAFYMALSIGCTILIFPQTLNHAWTITLIDKFFIPIVQRSQLHSQLLMTPPPTDDASAQKWALLQGEMESTGASLSESFAALMEQSTYLELEVSYGRLGAKDLIGLEHLLRRLHAASFRLGTVAGWVHHTHRRTSKRDQHGEAHPVDEARHHAKLSEKLHGQDLTTLLPILERASVSLRHHVDDTLLGSLAWLDSLNQTRYWSRPSKDTIKNEFLNQQRRIEALENALADFRKDGRAELCMPFADFFDPVTGEQLTLKQEYPFSPRSLFLCLSTSANLIWYAEAVLAVAKHLEELEGRRTSYRLWWPTGVRELGNLLKGGKGTASFSGDTESGDPNAVEQLVTQDEDSTADESAEQEAYNAMGGVGRKYCDQPLHLVILEMLPPADKDPDARPPKVRRSLSLAKRENGRAASRA
ncbi:hypothetical protein P7C70_g2307, partial [Phenoliferia sp. Uapishka_3]